KVAGLVQAFGDLAGWETQLAGGSSQPFHEAADWLRRKAYAIEQGIDDYKGEVPFTPSQKVIEFLSHTAPALGELAVESATPAGPIGAFAGSAGLETLGRTGSYRDAGIEALKGGATGALFEIAPPVGRELFRQGERLTLPTRAGQLLTENAVI